jgi:hypothetical protein
MQSSLSALFRGAATRSIVTQSLLWLGLCSIGLAQAPPAATPPPAAKVAAKPDLNGIWQAITTADWDIEPHGPMKGRVTALGAEDAMPPGTGIVEGGRIPYLAAALAQKQKNFSARLTDDPELKCYLPGVPRINYMPYPFQIVQPANGHEILIVYQYAGAVRTVNMGKPTSSPADTWMGWSNGHWVGNTLVVDVTSFNDQSWFDRVGDFHSDALHVVERYTPQGRDLIRYEATMDDPQTFSHSWKVSFMLYRVMDTNARLLEFKCPEFAEDLVYGHLRKVPVK